MALNLQAATPMSSPLLEARPAVPVIVEEDASKGSSRSRDKRTRTKNVRASWPTALLTSLAERFLVAESSYAIGTSTLCWRPSHT